MPEIGTGLILLDTHIWVWHINGDPRLKKPGFLRLIAAGASRGRIRVSIISVWEVAMLEAKKRLSFQTNCLEWIRAALQAPGLGLEPFTPEIAVDSTRLPGKFNGDPADRILAATARRLGATLITKDAEMLAYAQEKHLKACAP
jgi:PIN domain nuclease of toxin-antitoxin system